MVETPKPPYYAVIFSSVRTESDEGYSEMANYMIELAKKQDGFLGVESARQEVGITVSYWRDLESIKNWKEHSEHTIARNKGRSTWYRVFKVRIAKVEKDYGFGL
jgi:heme-degrading monooxygenase HmoA